MNFFLKPAKDSRFAKRLLPALLLSIPQIAFEEFPLGHDGLIQYFHQKCFVEQGTAV
jgi:hypothetical protein